MPSNEALDALRPHSTSLTPVHGRAVTRGVLFAAQCSKTLTVHSDRAWSPTCVVPPLMPDPAITLCTSEQLAILGPVAGIVAVCDSPVTVEQIVSSPAFVTWPESASMLSLALGEDTTGTHQGHNLPVAASRLLEAPYRTSVVLSGPVSGTALAAGSSLSQHAGKPEASAVPLAAESLWRRLIDALPGEVWTGSLPTVRPSARTAWPTLVPARPPHSWLAKAIHKVKGVTPRQTTLLRAGLYLMHDFMDESHSQSQSMEGDRDADLWHAIMHRREPDYGNAKYWCRRVAQHPIFGDLVAQAVPILDRAGISGFSSTTWDAARFVDLCERVEREESPANLAAREVQWLEMSLHLAHCSRGR